MFAPARDLAAVIAAEPGVHGLVAVDTVHRRDLRAVVLLGAGRLLGRLGERLVEVVELVACALRVGEGATRRIAAKGPRLRLADGPPALSEDPAETVGPRSALPHEDLELGNAVGCLAGSAAFAATTANRAGQDGQTRH